MVITLPEHKVEAQLVITSTYGDLELRFFHTRPNGTRQRYGLEACEKLNSLMRQPSNLPLFYVLDEEEGGMPFLDLILVNCVMC